MNSAIISKCLKVINKMNIKEGIKKAKNKIKIKTKFNF